MLEIRLLDSGTIKLKGRLDASKADEAMLAFKKLQGPVTADFAELDYISSAGISVIIETHRRLTGAGHPFRLINMQPRVRNVFMYSGLDRVLKIE